MKINLVSNQKTLTCAFCRGTGRNPHFGGACSVCRGKGRNQIKGNYVTCRDCRGLGQKRGTTLTCYTCGGLGVLPDTREEVRRARREIRDAREEMARERPARQRPEPHPPASSREASRAGAMAGGGEFREKPEARGNEQEAIDKLKEENERLRKGLSKAKSPPEVDRGREKGGMESAIGSYCEDCALGENKECWDIECALAPFSPVGEAIK